MSRGECGPAGSGDEAKCLGHSQTEPRRNETRPVAQALVRHHAPVRPVVQIAGRGARRPVVELKHSNVNRRFKVALATQIAVEYPHPNLLPSGEEKHSTANTEHRRGSIAQGKGRRQGAMRACGNATKLYPTGCARRRT